MAHCPACAEVNPDRALACAACGTPLVMRCPACDAINVRTRVRCHHCAALLDPGLSPQAAPVGETPAPPVVPTLTAEDDGPVAADWVLTLRDDPWPAVSPPAASAIVWPTVDPSATWGVQPGPPAQATRAPAQTPAPSSAPMPGEDLAARKVRRRAAVRRAQMSAQASPHRHAPGHAQGQAGPAAEAAAPVDVLVLEADPRARATLCETLAQFGFRPHAAVSAAEAAGLCRRQRHVAAFLGLGSDVDTADTEALCRSLHDAPRGRPLALIAIGDPRRHAERIRMQLAGADRLLLRPVGRGDIARALDDCGLALPRDPRRHA